MGKARFIRKMNCTHLPNKYLIFENNKKILLEDDVTEVELRPGYHTVYVKERKLCSHLVEFEIMEDQTIEFEVGYIISDLRVLFDIWAAIFKRDNYMYIKKRV